MFSLRQNGMYLPIVLAKKMIYSTNIVRDKSNKGGIKLFDEKILQVMCLSYDTLGWVLSIIIR